MAAQRARRRRHVSGPDRRSRDRAAGAGRPRVRRVDRGRDGDDGPGRRAPAGAGGRDGAEAARGRHLRSGDRQLYRLRPRRVSRSGGVRPDLRRCDDRPAGRLGYLPRDVLSDCLEAVHVQPDPAAPVGRGEGAAHWWCGATTTGSCRAAPAKNTRPPCPRRGSRSCARRGIASTWSSRKRWPGWSAALSPRIRSERGRPARKRAGGPRSRRQGATIGPRRNPCM